MIRLTLLFFFISLVWGQSEFQGHWISKNLDFNPAYPTIYVSQVYKTKTGQYIDKKSYSFSTKQFDLVYTLELIDPWFGDSYVEYKDEKNNPDYQYWKMIDEKTLLWGVDKHINIGDEISAKAYLESKYRDIFENYEPYDLYQELLDRTINKSNKE